MGVCLELQVRSIGSGEVLRSMCGVGWRRVSGLSSMMVAIRTVEAVGASAGCVDARAMVCRNCLRIHGLVW